MFPNGDEVELGSRKERPMTRCFPRVVEAVRANLSARCVVDAEGNKIVVDFLTREPVATVAPIRRTPKPMASPG